MREEIKSIISHHLFDAGNRNSAVAGFQQAKWQTGGQTGSEFTAHLRQDEAMPWLQRLSDSPLRLSPLPFRAVIPRVPPPLTSPPTGCLGPVAADGLFFPEGGTRQNRKCPDMSFRRGQFATRNWMIDSDNRPGGCSYLAVDYAYSRTAPSPLCRKRIAGPPRHYCDSLSSLPASTVHAGSLRGRTKECG